MPLEKIEKIKEGRFVAIWHITETLDELFGHISLNEKQVLELSSYKAQTKQLEWLTGRILVKMLAEKFDIKLYQIDKDENGKPLLPNESVEISLSHSYPYVAAIIDKTEPVGIDIEQPKEKLRTIAHKFLSDNEIGFIENDLIKLCLGWCAKETLYKIYSKRGLIFKEHLLLSPYSANLFGTISGTIMINGSVKSHKLDYIVTEDYVLTYNIS